MSPPRKPLLPDDEPALISDAEALADERLSRIVTHPDGVYWIAPDGHQQFGPFDSVEAALADMAEPVDEVPDTEPPTLEEAEDALGLSGWIDPDTGALAEETHTRIEEH